MYIYIYMCSNVKDMFEMFSNTYIYEYLYILCILIRLQEVKDGYKYNKH